MQYLCALIQEIERTPEIREILRYYPNDSLYKLGNKYRYIEYHYKKTKRYHNVVSLEVDEALEQVLSLAAEGATVEELTNSFSMRISHVTRLKRMFMKLSIRRY